MDLSGVITRGLTLDDRLLGQLMTARAAQRTRALARNRASARAAGA